MGSRAGNRPGCGGGCSLRVMEFGKHGVRLSLLQASSRDGHGTLCWYRRVIGKCEPLRCGRNRPDRARGQGGQRARRPAGSKKTNTCSWRWRRSLRKQRLEWSTAVTDWSCGWVDDTVCQPFRCISVKYHVGRIMYSLALEYNRSRGYLRSSKRSGHLRPILETTVDQHTPKGAAPPHATPLKCDHLKTRLSKQLLPCSAVGLQ